MDPDPRSITPSKPYFVDSPSLNRMPQALSLADSAKGHPAAPAHRSQQTSARSCWREPRVTPQWR